MQVKWMQAGEVGISHLLPATLFSKWKNDIWGSEAAAERLIHSEVKPVHFLTCSLFLSPSIQNPSTIGEEKQYNPFLRSHSAELHLALDLQQFHDEDWTQFRARVLEELRRRKDLYKRR